MAGSITQGQNISNLVLQLFAVFSPIVKQIIAAHKASTGVEPTDAEVIATFTANIAKYLGEGATWTATHPKSPV